MINNELLEEYNNKNFLSNLLKKYLNHYSGIPLNCWQRIFLTFINDMATGVCFFLSLYFVGTLHFTAAKAGLIISCYGLGKAGGGILGGKLTDKFLPDVVIISSLLLEIISFLAFLKFSTFPILAIFGFILGISVYAFTTANKVCVLNSIRGHEDIKLKILSTFYAASNLGIGISAIYIGWLARYGFNYVFILSCVFLTFSTLFVCYQARKKPINSSSISMSQEDNKKTNEVIHSQQSSLIACLVLACLFSIGLIIAQLGTTYPLYLANKFPALDVNAVSIVFTLNSFFILFFQTPVVNYFNKNNKILMVGIGAFFMAGGMAILSVAFSFSIVIFSMLIFTIGEMIFFAMAQLVIYQHSRADKKGQSLGLFQTTLAASVIIGPTLGGYTYDNFGGQMLWYSCGLLGLFWLLITMYFKKYDFIC